MADHMNRIENRLHRVMIKLSKEEIICKFANACEIAENCDRCNIYYLKCSIFKDFSKI